MTKYVGKRIVLALVTLFIVCGITFFAMNAIPGGPFDGEKAISPEVKAEMEKRFNLDKPVSQQFIIYMKNILHGDFGVSAKTGRDIGKTISTSFKVSAKLGAMAIITAVVFTGQADYIFIYINICTAKLCIGITITSGFLY